MAPVDQDGTVDLGHPAWEFATLAASLFALDPHRFGGVRLRALPGPVRDEWLDLVRELLPAATPTRRMPASVTVGRLLGGLDLSATLSSGKPVMETGLLAECDGGVIIAAMAERLSSGVAAVLGQALDLGEIRAEREGLSAQAQARFGLIAIDEGLEADDEAVAPALLDRMAFDVALEALSYRDLGVDAPAPEDILEARELLPEVTIADDLAEGLAAASVMLGIPSIRPLHHALDAARGLAALDGRDAVTQEHAARAAQLCLAPKARALPPPPVDEVQPPDEPSPPDQTDQDQTDDRDDPAQMEDKPLEDVVLNAAEAAIPADLLARLKADMGLNRGPRSEGKAGAVQKAKRRGRPAGVRPGDLAQGLRLNVIETLRAAAPWQGLRRRTSGEAGERSKRVHVTKQDFRFTHLKHRSETATIFVVDASGSAALHRLAEVKGAVELLLAECYVRRDQVALIAFRGEGAELILPPTRSLVRAKRQLAGLPGGGGTPLASGLEQAALLADSLKRKGLTPVVLVLTDGRPNITRAGAPGRAAALDDAKAAAKLLRAGGVASVLVDSSPRRNPQAADLARDMDAVYLALPRASSQGISNAVSAVAPGVSSSLGR